MIDTPTIVETQAQLTAVIHLDIAREQMPAEFGHAINEVLQALSAQGIEPRSAALAYHLRMPPGRFDLEVGFVVSDTIAASGRVKASQLPAGRVARTIYRGPYQGLPTAWDTFTQWMNDQGVKQGEDLWELYSVGPHVTTDDSEYQTELNRPLRG